MRGQKLACKTGYLPPLGTLQRWVITAPPVHRVWPFCIPYHMPPTSSDRTPPTLDRCVTGPGTLSLCKPSFPSGKAANHSADHGDDLVDSEGINWVSEGPGARVGGHLLSHRE